MQLDSKNLVKLFQYLDVPSFHRLLNYYNTTTHKYTLATITLRLVVRLCQNILYSSCNHTFCDEPGVFILQIFA